MPPAPNGLQQYVKLEERLTLLAWLNHQFGFKHNSELLADLKEAGEGSDAAGRSFLYHRLIARGQKVKIAAADLARYDDNIAAHLEAMNAGRPEAISLRYFQYLAALYTEIFLDAYFNRRAEMLRSLNAFVAARNAQRLAVEPQDAMFTEGDLKKLAFWMATGSGKTLIMHLNYRQFLHYNTEPLDNILLVTPNEGLTEQHLAELEASGIPARRFDLNESGLNLAAANTVRVIEITKLVEQKRGGGVSVPVEAFEGNNLIFVDEGHKGSGGEVWRGYRDALGKTGFTFEYSATFGQALTAARNDQLTAEYGKAIVFDYSYRYFHGDGYGKDFRVLNLKQETTAEGTETLLLGNLLAFYEQQRVFQEQTEALRPYNLERPLWVFVGSTVNAVYSEDKQKRSDVLTVVTFLHHVLENKRGWVVKTIKKLLDGKSGLKTPDGSDVFVGRFAHLRESGLTPEALYLDMLSRALHAPSSGSLHLCDMRGGAGELGLKASGAEDYFGLIYIGDTSAFKKLVEEHAADIAQTEDAISNSLFDDLSRPDTCIEILIGAKKFMEGWNSWRVSAMGLLNIGRQEGSQIIQLFGRGVRLRGKGFSLKRSKGLDGVPQHLGLLETLSIFAVRANYMSQFRDYLEKEGVEIEEAVELPLFVWANQEFLQRGLVVPRVPDDCQFASEATLLLAPDSAVQVHMDLSLKVETIQSSGAGFTVVSGQAGREYVIPKESLELVDWERVYLDLLAYKERKRLDNLVISRHMPRAIIAHKTDKGLPLYRLVADETVVQPTTFSGVQRLQDAVTSILRKYIDDFYRIKREQYESQHMVYLTLDQNDPNLSFNRQAIKEGKTGYVVKVRRSERELIEAIEKLDADMRKLATEEAAGLQRLHFDRHLYQPLLLKHDGIVGVAPPILAPSEADFVNDLKAYWNEEKDRSLAGRQVYLLRNLSRGSGIGFFEERGFYPDFILWIVDKKTQHIVFVEPHGMLHAPAYQHDKKAGLHEELPALARDIAKRSVQKHVTLDSYIVSATPYDDLHTKYDDGSWDKERFANVHILFPERSSQYDYMVRIFIEQLTKHYT